MAKKRGSKNKSGCQDRLKRWLRNATLIAMALAIVLLWAVAQDSPFNRWKDEWINRQGRSAAVEGRRIGIVAGHMDSDSGAVCPDGLIEADVVQDIAERTAKRLRQAGAQVDLLAEYDSRLNGYAGDTLVSIHADACVDRSGFKTARSQTSAIPAVEDRLVACLNQHYGDVTGLAFDEYTITGDMIGYHAFYRIAPQTPAAIIETGFLGGDRTLLTARPELVARGVTDGVICFLEANN